MNPATMGGSSGALQGKRGRAAEGFVGTEDTLGRIVFGITS